MDYEKLYNEAIERAKKHCANYVVETIFPELAESEDERIRKALIKFHKSTIDIDGIKGDDIVAWLEAQGEQKLVEWSKEDEKIIIRIKKALEDFYPTSETDKIKNWFKFLKYRVQPKQD